MITCPVDEFVPLPIKRKAETLSYNEVRGRAKAALRAAAQLDAEGYQDAPADMDFVRALTQGSLRKMTQGGTVTSAEAAAATNTPEGCLYVDSLLSAYDMQVVNDAKRLRNYVTNKLVIESENMDARIRMRALELLGKISDVGLFTERTEITVNNRSTVELEDSLREKLRRIMGTSDAEDAKILIPPVETTANVSPRQALAGF
jgi:hypothetical protein